MENGYVEDFNGGLRDECLNENWFCSLAEARGTIEAWRQDYNQHRPHSALGYCTPEGFAKRRTGTVVAEPPWKTARVSHFPPASTAAGINL
jgi:putative transposase